MSDKTKAFLEKCAKNKKSMLEDYSNPSISALDHEDIVDMRGGSATTTTTTGAAVAAGVSAIF